MGFTVWTEPPQEFLLPGTADDSGTKKLSAQILLVLNKHWTPTTHADTWGKVKKWDKIEGKQWRARIDKELEVNRVRAQTG